MIQAARSIRRPRHLARARPTAKGQPSLFVLVIVLGALGLGTLVGLESEEIDLAFALATAAATFSLGWIFVAAYRESGNALHPICLSAIFLALHFPFHGVVMRGKIRQMDVLGSDADRWSIYALLLVAAVYPFLWFGFRSKLAERMARRLPKPRRAIDDTGGALATKLGIVYAIGTLGRILSIAGGLAFHFQSTANEEGLAGVQFIFVILVTLPTIVMLYLVACGVRHKMRVRLRMGLALLVIEIAWGILSGSRSTMLYPILALLVVAGETWRPIRVRDLAVMLVLFALVTFPFLTAFRAAYFRSMETIEREGVQGSTLVNALTVAANGNTSMGTSSDVDPIVTLASRTHGLTSLALILAETPENQDWLLGAPYLMLPAQILVPRIIWPDKPLPGEFPQVFRELYWGADRGETTSLATTQIGELYVNLHVFGCILGTFFFGALLRLFKDRLRFGAGPLSSFPVACYAWLVIQAVPTLEGPLIGYLAGMPKTLLVLAAVGFFLGSPVRKPVAA